MLDEYERALYGALCGDISSVLPVCETWQDQLWAYFNALVQARVEKVWIEKEVFAYVSSTLKALDARISQKT